MKTADLLRNYVKNTDHEDKDVLHVAQEIIDYLIEHPSAADSLEGVVNWWLARQRIKSATLIVKQALDHLVDKGMVAKITHKGGQPIYTYKADHEQKH